MRAQLLQEAVISQRVAREATEQQTPETLLDQSGSFFCIRCIPRLGYSEVTAKSAGRPRTDPTGCAL
jgi:hypothetical protein